MGDPFIAQWKRTSFTQRPGFLARFAPMEIHTDRQPSPHFRRLKSPDPKTPKRTEFFSPGVTSRGDELNGYFGFSVDGIHGSNGPCRELEVGWPSDYLRLARLADFDATDLKISPENIRSPGAQTNSACL